MFLNHMKTCPNCKTEFEENIVFCPYCGVKLYPIENNAAKCSSCGTEIPNGARFCPKCGIPFDIFADIELKTLSFKGAFNWGSVSTIPCTIIVNRYKVTIEWNVITRIFEFGERPEIRYKDITHAGIIVRRNTQLLCIQDSDGDQGYFSSMSMRREQNREFVKRIACIIEFYRRIYWWYDEYKSEDQYAGEVSVGRFEDAVQDMSSVSNEELIEFYKSIS